MWPPAVAVAVVGSLVVKRTIAVLELTGSTLTLEIVGVPAASSCRAGPGVKVPMRPLAASA